MCLKISPIARPLATQRHGSMFIIMCVRVCVYVCVCLHSSNFILTSVVLTGLSWGAVLTDGHKEKQHKSEVSKYRQHHSAAKFMLC